MWSMALIYFSLISFLDITEQKPEYTWLAGAVTTQGHMAFPVKFLFINVVLFLFKRHGEPKMLI